MKQVAVGAAVVAASFGAGQAAFAVPFEAACHGENGKTNYDFAAHVEAEKGAAPPGFWEVTEHGGLFVLLGDLDGPDDAKNDYVLELRASSNGEIVRDPDDATREYRVETPDTIDFGDPYRADLDGWFVENRRFVFARFVAAFDKRDEPDAHCTAETTSFVVDEVPRQQVCIDERCEVPPGGIVIGGS